MFNRDIQTVFLGKLQLKRGRRKKGEGTSRIPCPFPRASTSRSRSAGNWGTERAEKEDFIPLCLKKEK